MHHEALCWFANTLFHDMALGHLSQTSLPLTFLCNDTPNPLMQWVDVPTSSQIVVHCSNSSP